MLDPDCVWQWLQGCPNVHDLFFRYGRVEAGDALLAPVDGGETAQRRFLNGAEERRSRFGLVRFAQAPDAPNEPDAMAAQRDLDAIAAWIEAQERDARYPALPEGCTALAAGVLSAESRALSQPAGIGRYALTFYIDYLYEPEDEISG